jgi:hypothetical protein
MLERWEVPFAWRSLSRSAANDSATINAIFDESAIFALSAWGWLMRSETFCASTLISVGNRSGISTTR